MAITGSCMCGEIKYESSSAKPDITALCHCTDCQKVYFHPQSFSPSGLWQC
jgi:hypothetical protein